MFLPAICQSFLPLKFSSVHGIPPSEAKYKHGSPVSHTKHIYFRQISKVEFPSLVVTASSHRYIHTLQLTNQVFFSISSSPFRLLHINIFFELSINECHCKFYLIWLNPSYTARVITIFMDSNLLIGKNYFILSICLDNTLCHKLTLIHILLFLHEHLSWF